MRHQRDARGDQLRPRRLDLDVVFCLEATGPPYFEANAVIGARMLAVLELGLRHRRPEIDIPERRRFELIRCSALQQTEERRLRHPLGGPADRRVGARPVHRQAQIPPQVLERFLVLGRQPVAQLDEVRPRDGDRRASAACPEAGTPGRTAATDRTARRSSSARAARSAARCRPIPSDRTRPCRASVESAR